ncbi:lipoprotein YmcC precursor [Photobacterium jeanii]|uniref:Lipoprotein YmcC n=1 Tax=Photobacterium jeanii TaxID=858640 RepID=A0A178K878_9GAMM|nr:YjbF family lipoprotein [Photobacterium jeanii]OAN13528.1 lipoprotein YmcC precursor [Photobacterium jeanii]PST88643.1 YjbF family lipoprotein [Photobacterium jeanii]
MRRSHFTIPFSGFFLCLTLISGCSQKFQDVNDTAKLALLGDDDTVLSTSKIEQLPYASMYARIGDGPQAFMVLAFAEHNSVQNTQPSSLEISQTIQLKWLSADKGLIVTQAGRIIKTASLSEGNLIAINSKTTDPLALGLHKSSTPKYWTRTIDWQPGYHFGYTLRSTFSNGIEQIVMVNQKPTKSLYYTESVNVPSIEQSYQNEFWVDPQTGAVLKSRQKLAPNLPVVEFSILKPFS